MRSLALRLVLTAALLPGLLLLTACDPPTARAAGPIHCNVMLDPPHRDNDRTPKRILSQVRFWCENPGADRLSLTLRMQKLNSKGVWVDVARSSFTVRGKQTTRTDKQRYRTRQVSVACAGGAYRTTVAGSSVGRRQTSTYDLTGARAADPCHPAIFFT